MSGQGVHAAGVHAGEAQTGTAVVAVRQSLAARDTLGRVLETEVAQVCGLLNSTAGALVGLIAKVIAADTWQGWGIHSPEQWVSWKCGVSSGRARRLVAMARRMHELPDTAAALQAGELSEDQVHVIARYAPAHNDAEAVALARFATVFQLRRSLGEYFGDPPPPDPTDSTPDTTDKTDATANSGPDTGTNTGSGAGTGLQTGPQRPPARRVSFGHDDDGTWRLFARLGPDEGALVERSLTEAREALFRLGHPDTDGSDAPGSIRSAASPSDQT